MTSHEQEHRQALPSPDPVPLEALEHLRGVWAEEADIRASAQMGLIVDECLRSEDWRVVKLAGQYDHGVITSGEFEQKLREVLR